MVGARMANLKKGGDAGIHKTNPPMGGLVPAVSIKRAAELSGSSRKSVERAKQIVTNGIPELQEAAGATDCHRWPLDDPVNF